MMKVIERLETRGAEIIATVEKKERNRMKTVRFQATVTDDDE
jgi:hypothetical protein